MLSGQYHIVANTTVLRGSEGRSLRYGGFMKDQKYKHTEIIFTREGHNTIRREICNQEKVSNNDNS